MATITHAPVTLTHEEAAEVCKMLSALSATDWGFARATKSLGLRAFTEARASAARDLESSIVRRMFATTDEAR